MLNLLCIPHSNDSFKRVFSQVRKVKINFRLAIYDKTLRSILIAKGACSGQCFEQTFTPSTLHKAKSTCQNALKGFTEPKTSSDMQIITPDLNKEQS
jgi:hypothetical protein